MKKNKSYILNQNNLSPILKIKYESASIFNKGVSLLRKNIFSATNKPVIYTVLILTLLGDVFFTSDGSDVIFFGLVGAFVITNILYKLKSKYIFILCLTLLIIMYIFFLLQGPSNQAEKVAVWIFLFMVVGIAQQWFENEKK